MFRGLYGGSQKHQDDLDIVLKRSWTQGLQKMIITVGTLNEADEALALAQKDGMLLETNSKVCIKFFIFLERLYITMGCHPTRCGEFLQNPEKYYEDLRSKISANPSKVVAIGECGLDYDRLHFCEKDTQKEYFEKQLSLAEEFQLPLFLHCRNSHDDFIDILKRNKTKLDACGGGVVHSFTGTLDEAQSVFDFHPNLYIGINGCSLKTEENLNVIRHLPNDRLMLETDCPWCGIRPSHAGQKFVQTKFNTVKKKEKWTAESLIDGRCEPCQIR